VDDAQTPTGGVVVAETTPVSATPPGRTDAWIAARIHRGFGDKA